MADFPVSLSVTEDPPLPKPHRSLSSPGPGHLGSFLLAGAVLASLGCQRESVARYKVPKEVPFTAPAPPPPPTGMSSRPGAAPATPAPGPAAGGLKWALPKGWTQEPGEGMRFATLKPPMAGRLEITVVVLPGPAGGELANVNRWRGQIDLAPLDEAALAKARTVLKTRAGAVNVYDFTSDAKGKSRMVAGYITTPDGNTWFLKLSGDASLAAKARPDFMRILESLSLD